MKDTVSNLNQELEQDEQTLDFRLKNTKSNCISEYLIILYPGQGQVSTIAS